MKRKTPPPNIIIISIYDEEIMKIRPTAAAVAISVGTEFARTPSRL